MLPWFNAKPECPVDAATKDWIDRRWAWLTQEFGLQRLRDATVVLPLAQFFPDEFDGRPEDAQRMLDRVCGYMGVDPAGLKLSIYTENNPVFEGQWQRGTSGLYQQDGEQHHIWIEQANLGDPVGMVGTMAHELGHVHLLGNGRISDETADHEPLTDLLTVFLGLGVFTANSVIYEQYLRQGAYARERMGKRGYLTMPQFAYALALFARDRAEEQPAWAEHLRPDVREPFANACCFLAAPPETAALPARAAASTAIQALTEEVPFEDGEEPARRPLAAADLLRRFAAGERVFREVDLQDMDLQGVNLRGCGLEGADLSGANLSDATLADADLREVDAQAALFINADLRDVDLRDADFSGADLTGADLTGADIRGADFQGAILRRTILTGVQRNAGTDFSDADLSTAVTDIPPQQENLRGVSRSALAADGLTTVVIHLCGYLAVLAICMILGAVVGTFLDMATWTVTGAARMSGHFTMICGLLSGGFYLRYAVRQWQHDRQSSANDEHRRRTSAQRLCRWAFVLWLLVVAMGVGAAIGGWVDFATTTYPHRSSDGGFGAVAGSLVSGSLFLWCYFRYWSSDDED